MIRFCFVDCYKCNSEFVSSWFFADVDNIIWRYSFLVRSDKSADHQDGIRVLQSNVEFQQHLVTSAIARLQQVAQRGHCDGVYGRSADQLVKFCSAIARYYPYWLYMITVFYIYTYIYIYIDEITLSAQHLSEVSKCRQTKVLQEYALSSCDEFDAEKIWDHSQVEEQSRSPSF